MGTAQPAIGVKDNEPPGDEPNFLRCPKPAYLETTSTGYTCTVDVPLE